MNSIIRKFSSPMSILIAIILVACSPSPSSTYKPQEYDSGQGSVSGSGGNYFHLPTSPEVPPSDVIQQISWGGMGGEGCETDCISVDSVSAISLYGFKPNQKLRIDFYQQNPDTGMGEFLAEITVVTDGNGKVALETDRDVRYLQEVVRDNSGNELIP